MPPQRPKRPRRQAIQDRSRQTVEVLLEAAARVLRQRGYARATTNRIADAAGVSVGTLYEYFADKDAIFDALIERQIDSLVRAIGSETFDRDTPIGSVLERILGLAMGALHHGPDLIRALEYVPGGAFRRRLAVARKGVIDYIRKLLDAHRSELRVSDLDLAAFIVVSSAEGIAANATNERFDERLVTEIGSLLDLYLTGNETSRGDLRP